MSLVFLHIVLIAWNDVVHPGTGVAHPQCFSFFHMSLSPLTNLCLGCVAMSGCLPDLEA